MVDLHGPAVRSEDPTIVSRGACKPGRARSRLARGHSGGRHGLRDPGGGGPAPAWLARWTRRDRPSRLLPGNGARAPDLPGTPEPGDRAVAMGGATADHERQQFANLGVICDHSNFL